MERHPRPSSLTDVAAQFKQVIFAAPNPLRPRRPIAQISRCCVRTLGEYDAGLPLGWGWTARPSAPTAAGLIIRKSRSAPHPTEAESRPSWALSLKSPGRVPLFANIHREAQDGVSQRGIERKHRRRSARARTGSARCTAGAPVVAIAALVKLLEALRWSPSSRGPRSGHSSPSRSLVTTCMASYSECA